jgi:sulfide:quinone oxidoreductase
MPARPWVVSRSEYAGPVEGYTVVICGGGIAAVEALLRLRRLTGEALNVKLVAPNDELRYRPLAVHEPFALRGVRRHPLRRIASRTGIEWIKDAAEAVDLQAQTLHTSEGHSIGYDALLLALGARSTTPFEHVTVFDDADADDAYHGIVQDVEGGYTRSLALVLPEGPAWLLPAYELALMTAERAESMGEEGLSINIVTPEPAPLAALGETASKAVSKLLEQDRIRVHTGAQPRVPANRRVLVTPDGPELEVGRVVALPRIDPRPLRNVPVAADGFVPVDELSRVPDTAEHVFAAGDATNLPLKHGGLGAQQADVAAAGIAKLAGAAVEPEPLRPVVRGVLYTGRSPLYVTARLLDGRVESEVTTEPAWPADEKVVTEELGPFLRSLD